MPPSAAPAPSADVSWVSQPQVSEHEKWLAARVHSNSSSSKEISLEKLGFCWDQTDDEVRVYFSLPGTSSDNVSANFSHRTCALTAEVGGSRYFFEIKRTYAPIDPELSRTRIPKSQKNVSLRLRKQKAGVEWPGLRCVDNEIDCYVSAVSKDGRAQMIT